MNGCFAFLMTVYYSHKNSNKIFAQFRTFHIKKKTKNPIFYTMFSSETSDSFSKTDPDSFPNRNPTQPNQTGLTRFRSAPSSFFALLNSDTENSSSGDEAEAMFSALLNGSELDLNRKKNDPVTRPGSGNGFCSSGQQMGYVGSYDLGKSEVGLNVNGKRSNLVRQSSSPVGFFQGFSLSGETGNFDVKRHQETGSSISGLNSRINLSSGPSTSLSFMPMIPEAGNESTDTCNARGSWNESSVGRLKRNGNGDLKHSAGLVHQMSLPKTASEMANVEKFLQFEQEIVPCQIRAKRGFATHPRSIAERVRRTRITDRMKKLQDLFPNIDKQTNQSDMLDLVVEYIKDLQKQVKTTTDERAKCICLSKPQ